MNETPKRAAAYMRVSTQEQRTQMNGLLLQKTGIQTYAELENIQIEDWFEEVGSAWKKDIFKRPLATAALNRAEELGYIIVSSLDRLSRNEENLLEALRGRGIKVISVKEGNLSLSNIEARVRMSKKASQAKSESALRHNEARKKRGEPPRNPRFKEAQASGLATQRQQREEDARLLAAQIAAHQLPHVSAEKLEQELAARKLTRSGGYLWTAKRIRTARRILQELQAPPAPTRVMTKELSPQELEWLLELEEMQDTGAPMPTPKDQNADWYGDGWGMY